MTDFKDEILQNIRSIVSNALNKRSDTKKIKENSVGDYVQENTDTMTEIEEEITIILNNY